MPLRLGRYAACGGFGAAAAGHSIPGCFIPPSVFDWNRTPIRIDQNPKRFGTDQMLRFPLNSYSAGENRLLPLLPSLGLYRIEPV